MGLLDELRIAREANREAYKPEDLYAARTSWQGLLVAFLVLGAAFAATLAVGCLLPGPEFHDWVMAPFWVLAFSLVLAPLAYRLGFRAQASGRLGSVARTAVLTWAVSAISWPMGLALGVAYLPVAHGGGWRDGLAAGEILLGGLMAVNLVARILGAMSAARTEEGSPPSDDGGQRQQPDESEGPPPATAAP